MVVHSLPSLSHPLPSFCACSSASNLNPNLPLSVPPSLAPSAPYFLINPPLFFLLTHYVPTYLSHFFIYGVYSCPPSPKLSTSHFTITQHPKKDTGKIQSLF
ncbi:hypothetical protein GOODEAATRI_013102, partial [Goodea atripinnis]